ncbi:MAG: hypothetical protein NC350_03995 [Corallococcus sp.]|nr:hypothetical protein [Corallococcus sp.]
MFKYDDLLDEIQMFNRYDVETGIVGESTLGQAIPYIFVGEKTGNYLIVQAAIHAREHITALLALCQAKHLVKNRNLKLDGGIYFVPMSNPDGVRLCQEGVGFVGNKTVKNNLLTINGGSDFSLWKANAEGVDLNVNFDARWGQGDKNVFYKASENYVGKYPNSEAETRALIDFTTRINPVGTISYHCKGEIIYWQFGQTNHRLWRDKRYAEALASYTGYSLVDDEGSVGGYKDWCIQTLKIPSYTIEVGSDDFEHPYPYKQFEKILQQNLDLPRKLLNTIVRDNRKLAEGNLPDAIDEPAENSVPTEEIPPAQAPTNIQEEADEPVDENFATTE